MCHAQEHLLIRRGSEFKLDMVTCNSVDCSAFLLRQWLCPFAAEVLRMKISLPNKSEKIERGVGMEVNAKNARLS